MLQSKQKEFDETHGEAPYKPNKDIEYSHKLAVWPDKGGKHWMVHDLKDDSKNKVHSSKIESHLTQKINNKRTANTLIDHAKETGMASHFEPKDASMWGQTFEDQKSHASGWAHENKKQISN